MSAHTHGMAWLNRLSIDTTALADTRKPTPRGQWFANPRDQFEQRLSRELVERGLGNFDDDQWDAVTEACWATVEAAIEGAQ